MDFKTYYTSTIIKTMWYQHKDIGIDGWNRIYPCIYGQLVFCRDRYKGNSMGDWQSFRYMELEKLEICIPKTKMLDPTIKKVTQNGLRTKGKS